MDRQQCRLPPLLAADRVLMACVSALVVGAPVQLSSLPTWSISLREMQMHGWLCWGAAPSQASPAPSNTRLTPNDRLYPPNFTLRNAFMPRGWAGSPVVPHPV